MSNVGGRIAAALLVVVATLATTTGVAGAAPPAIFHGGGLVRGGSTTLTDCPPPPSETNCNATLFRAQEPGFVLVDLLAIETHLDGTFDFEFVNSGFTDAATVQIDKDLASGRASGWVPMDVGDPIWVDVSWTGGGAVNRLRFDDGFHDECVTVQAHFRDRVRAATATGVIDGSTQGSVNIPGAPPNELFRSAGGFVQVFRCEPPPG